MPATARTGLGTESAQNVYNRLKENRAENCAKVTIPSLFPKASDTDSTTFPTPCQGGESRGVNLLSAKVMRALFPQKNWICRFHPTPR